MSQRFVSLNGLRPYAYKPLWCKSQVITCMLKSKTEKDKASLLSSVLLTPCAPDWHSCHHTPAPGRTGAASPCPCRQDPLHELGSSIFGQSWFKYWHLRPQAVQVPMSCLISKLQTRHAAHIERRKTCSHDLESIQWEMRLHPGWW